LIIVGNGVVEVTFFSIGTSAIEVSISIIGLELYGLVEIGESVIVITNINIGNSAVIVGPGVVSVGHLVIPPSRISPIKYDSAWDAPETGAASEQLVIPPLRTVPYVLPRRESHTSTTTTTMPMPANANSLYRREETTSASTPNSAQKPQ